MKILALTVCLVVLAVFVYWYSGGFRSETTMSATVEKIREVGGMAKVDQETKTIFDRYGTAEFRPLDNSDLKEFPAVSGLGNTFSIWPDASGCSGHIKVRYGYHMHAKTIWIFDPKKPLVFDGASACIQVSSNIFIDK